MGDASTENRLVGVLVVEVNRFVVARDRGERVDVLGGQDRLRA